MHDYYRKKSKKLIKGMSNFIDNVKEELHGKYRNKTSEICENALKMYQTYLEVFPYIGGDKNPSTRNLVMGAQSGALYEVLRPLGIAPAEVGKYTVKNMKLMFTSKPKWVLQIFGKIYTSKALLKKKKKRAMESQKKEFPGDWVYIIETSDDENTKYTVTYSECGLNKFFRKRGIEELTPYICNLDYLMFSMMGVPLYRTKTLGCNDEVCNFQILKNGKCPAYWPPQFLCNSGRK